MKTQINEIFPSIQGEGPYVGVKQLFIRFCKCNLNCCYCDTEYKSGNFYTPDELYNKIINNYDLNAFHSISLTGGEPLIDAEFLSEFLQKLKGKIKIYLETNATCTAGLSKVKNYIDIIAADIKLKSSTGVEVSEFHKKFFSECRGIETFAKIVFDSNITETEIKETAALASEYTIALILQPKMNGNKISVTPEFCNEILDKFIIYNKNVRLIPQVHKFLEVR